MASWLSITERAQNSREQSAVTSERTFSPYLLPLKTLERGKDDPMLAIVSGCFSLTQCSPRTIYIVFALQVGTLNPGD